MKSNIVVHTFIFVIIAGSLFSCVMSSFTIRKLDDWIAKRSFQRRSFLKSFCARRCNIGKGGNVCKCNGFHFAGKRTVTPNVLLPEEQAPEIGETTATEVIYRMLDDTDKIRIKQDGVIEDDELVQRNFAPNIETVYPTYIKQHNNNNRRPLGFMRTRNGVYDQAFVFVSDVSGCSDLDSSACALLQKSVPDFCATSPLSQSACQKFCGNCPVRCYHCPDHSVLDYKTCNNVTTCLPDESCMINTLVASDGHIEHIMGCGDKKYCDGLGFGFVGKRDVQTRDVSLRCCDTDLCNIPNYHTTIPPPTIRQTTPYPIKNCHRDIVFLIDESTSIGVDGFRYAIDFVIRVVSSLDIGIHGDQMSLLLYDQNPHIQWFLNEYTSKAELLTALTYVPYHNGITRTDVALKYIREQVLTFANGDRPSAQNAVIILTDGRSTVHANTVTEANRLHTADTTVIAIGLGDASVTQEIIDLATDSNHALVAHSAKDLVKAVPIVLSLLC